MKYLRKFATKADMADLEQPNVVLIGDTSEVLYNAVPNGVYIQHIDGKLYATDAWVAKGFTNDEANGVAVVNEKASFVIHPSNSTANKSWINPASLVEGVTTAANISAAVNDFAGKTNTEAILGTGNKDTAAYLWQTQSSLKFKNGGIGYIPSAGELNLIHENKAEINAAMAAIGGYSVDTYIWSSTQASAYKAWRLIGTGLETADKIYTISSRGILPLNI